MSDNLISLVFLHSIILFYTFDQLEAHTVLNTCEVACGKVKGADNILSKAVRSFEQTELAHLASGVGNVEVASASLACDVLHGLHDQVCSTLGFLNLFQEGVGRTEAFFRWGCVGCGGEAAA